jgi:hypothetical protein
MSKFEKGMENIFDIAPKSESLSVIVEPKNQIVDPKETSMDQDLNDAYQQSKDNLQEIIEQGKEAMNDILQIAKASEHPRAFEVFGTLLKNVTDANKELIAMQKNMREINGVKKDTGSTNIDKAIFVGTTAELSKMLKGK